ncbi:MAG: ABC transporter substrate-binding protein [Anaerolineae bacterium]|nr:ABC transporter substrate-binding protein [Anaerolineae bacterium]
MRKVLFLVLLALLVVTITPTVAQEAMGYPDFIQHTECSADLTGQTIPIYHFGDLSGSYAFITQPLLAGLADAIAYYNSHGGVCGATFKSEVGTEYRDTGGNREEAQAAYDFFSTIEDKPDLLILYASGDSELLRSQVAEDEIPVLISAGSVPGLYGEDAASPGWIYASNPLYTDQLGSYCQFVAGNAEMYPEPVIGYISWPGAFGEAAYTPETISYCASLGVTIVDTPEYFLPTATDITTNVQNLIDAGANILYTNSLASGPALVAKTIIDLGLEGEVSLAGVNWALDTSVGLLGQRTLGATGLPSVNGLTASIPFHWWTERQLPGIALINEQADANAREPQIRNIAYLLGWGIVDTYTELYIQTVNRVGSIEAVTGAEMKTTIESLSYSPLGLYTFDYQGGALRAVPDNRIGMMAFLNAEGTGPATSAADAMIVEAGDQKFFVPIIIPLTEFAPAPDLRPGGADVPS